MPLPQGVQSALLCFDPEYQAHLVKVATVAEIAWLWCVDKGSVYNWINQGLVAVTKSEGT